ncbi:MAG TPA: ImmA/IrrE family metallo-endopeptidase [Allosphingosinicella sp.]|nr:ImmA/IrrE family metallo-endopeptidase [Allosphingosinicella sp.]
MASAAPEEDRSADLDHARSVAEKAGALYTRPPIPVVEVARRHKVIVVPETFNRLSEKVAGICQFDSSRIHVNAADPPARQSYTIAHELGHWMLHRALFLKRPELYSFLPRVEDPPPSALEDEARHFADHLLVPRRLLAPVRKAPPVDLARIFGVPLEIIERRLENG